MVPSTVGASHDGGPAPTSAEGLPPIDCPLHKLGIDPTHLRPFASVEKYIAFLERPDRVRWQKPDQLVAALGLDGGETVFDLGAGSGYFAFRFAKALPRGRVIAGDTEAEMIRHIHHKAMSDGVGNLEVSLLKPEDPQVPAATDLVFVCDVLHHVADRARWLGRLFDEMKPGARLAIVEFKPGKLPQGPPESAKLSRAQIVAAAQTAGFTLADARTDLLPYQILLTFRKPASAAKP
jgi:predicted methyltransferase